MATMEEMIWLRDELVTARFTGARILKFQDREVTMRSDAEMAALIASLDRQIGTATPITTVRITSSKGL